MTITIPMFVIYIAATLAIVALVGLAIIGWMFLAVMKDFKINW